MGVSGRTVGASRITNVTGPYLSFSSSITFTYCICIIIIVLMIISIIIFIIINIVIFISYIYIYIAYMATILQHDIANYSGCCIASCRKYGLVALISSRDRPCPWSMPLDLLPESVIAETAGSG